MESDLDVRTELLEVLGEFLTDPADEDEDPVASPGRKRWRRTADLGVFAVPLPEADGGLGLGVCELVDVFEMLGAHRAPGPWVWTQLAALLRPELADGSAVVAGVDLARATVADPVVVPHLPDASLLLALTDRGAVLHAVTDVGHVRLDTPIDPSTPVARLDRWGDGELLAGPETAESLRLTGTLLTAAQQVGVSQAALDVAVEYAKGRRQFGRPIGSFQALKHLLADSYARTHLARAAVAATAELTDAGRADLAVADLHAAKQLAGRAADANARTAVQVFGGMGFAWETPPHLLLKRAWLLEHEFGTQREHALAVADLLAEQVVS